MSGARRREVLAVLGLLVILGTLRWLPAVLGRTAFVAEDFPVLNLPIRAYFGAGLREGRLVLWTPLLQGGFPLFAESQAGATYPLRALHALPVAPWTVLAWTIVLHFAWAGAGLYAYLRAVGTRREAALIPAVGFAFSALLVVRHQHTNVLEAISWWPWLLLAVELGVRGPSRRAWVWAGVAGGLMAMGGHVQYVVYGWTLAGAYGLVRMLGSEGRPWRRWLSGWLLAVGLGLGLAAAQYLPLWELVGHSIRSGGVGVWEASDQVLKPQHLPFFVAPGFWGRIFDPGYQRPHLPWEFVSYVGLLPLLLAVVGARRRSALTWLWLGLGLVGLVGALGDRFLFHRLLSMLPGWGGFRAPARLLSWYALAVAILAGLGCEELLAGRVVMARRGDLMAGGATLLALLAVAFAPAAAERIEPGSGASVRLALGLMTGFGLASYAWLRRAPRSGSWWPAIGAGLVLLDVMVTGAGFTPARPGAYSDPPPRFTVGVAVGPGRDPELLWYQPLTNLLIGQPNPFNMLPLTLRRQVELYDLARADESGAALRRWEQLMGVGMVPTELPDGRLALRQTSLSPLPPAWAARSLRGVAESEAERRATLATVAEEAVMVKPLGEPVPLATNAPASIALVEQTPNRSVYEAETAGPAFFVLNETPYPGRAVYIDGAVARLYRVNGVQSGVSIQRPGRHWIVVALRSTSIRVGRFVTLLILGLLAGMAVEARR